MKLLQKLSNLDDVASSSLNILQQMLSSANLEKVVKYVQN